AIELIATALTIQHGLIPPTVNITEVDDECDLDYVANDPRQQKVNVAISNSFAFGGLNAILVLKASDG
ncbi:beta-ACP synthase, partial [bacterium]|nr:beta-ACP synthase [bacterium]